MRIDEVVRRKGHDVITIRSDATVAELLDLLEQHHIGAVVVSDGDDRVDGIISERDLVPLVREDGAGARLVREVMTRDVFTCGPEEELELIARTMTDRRVRHLPVVKDGRMVAIVSIGDVVKNRLDELQTERDQLEGYVRG
ncbi:CBS domain-containing protein [Propionibacteriaceae bacterium Y1923]|uniref:CBS domain-containing protein n=1 Tax=Aestuariimicrobium sp. Y1814 TaxID=3418742 RepID=UPI003C18EB42